MEFAERHEQSMKFKEYLWPNLLHLVPRKDCLQGKNFEQREVGHGLTLLLIFDTICLHKGICPML
jgi:hypothetical protein